MPPSLFFGVSCGYKLMLGLLSTSVESTGTLTGTASSLKVTFGEFVKINLQIHECGTNFHFIYDFQFG